MPTPRLRDISVLRLLRGKSRSIDERKAGLPILIALVVNVYRRIHGRPLESLRLLTGLVAVLKYVYGLRINADFIVSNGVLHSGAVRTAIEEAQDDGLIRVKAVACRGLGECDEYGVRYVFLPGKRSVKASARIMALIEEAVRKYGRMEPRLILHEIAARAGIDIVSEGYVNLDELIPPPG